MADDPITTPNDASPPSTDITEAPQATASEAPREMPRHTGNGAPEPSMGAVPDHIGNYSFKRTWAQLAVGWTTAILLFALLLVAFYWLVLPIAAMGGGVIAKLVFVAAGVGAYSVFYFLDKDFWLSRTLGLQTGPNSSPLRSVIFSLVPGVSPRTETVRSAASATTDPTSQTKPKEDPTPKDLFREIAETVVFVIVLVLLLRTFVAEAFVIPTGSMATTLWGYQKIAVCPECGFTFPVNASSEADPQSEREPASVIAGTCPNCRNEVRFNPGGEPVANTGDRVLVMKCLYDTGLRPPKRGDVVVFKFPGSPTESGPEKDQLAINYIKRLCGLPNETIAIHGGKLYVSKGLDYSWKPKSEQPSMLQDGYLVDARLPAYTYTNDRKAVEKFTEPTGEDDPARFQIFRKPPGQVMAMRRPVYDNEFQRKDRPTRWETATSWQLDDPQHPKVFTQPAGAAEIAWLRYKNKINGEPELITDFLGYNATLQQTRTGGQTHTAGESGAWVGDLMLECTVDVMQATGDDEICLELSKGVDRFRAHFKPATGECTLGRLTDGKEQTLPMTEGGNAGLAAKASQLKGPGKHSLRFANVDERLLVWVDDALLFGDGVPYSAPKKEGPTEYDLDPASVGVKGAGVKIGELKVWRDTYYTCTKPASLNGNISEDVPENIRKNPREWASQVSRLPVMTMYVQPGHYLCLGDNSPQSSDSRVWGLVPDRLMLGRALAVYFPFYVPTLFPVNRVGPID